MKLLVTSGSTQMPIDRVRVITNIFKGTTGANIAWTAAKMGHNVTLIANKGVERIIDKFPKWGSQPFRIVNYRTFDELEAAMESEITGGGYDSIIHSAAVSDYQVANIFYDPKELANCVAVGGSKDGPASGKIPSTNELFMHLTPTKKLIDLVREPWGFNGKLVKFKLQVGMSEEELIEIAKRSRLVSKADFIVANLLEHFDDWIVPKMFIIGPEDKVFGCTRSSLAAKLIHLLCLNNY